MFGFKQIDNLLVLVKRMTTFFFLVEAIKIVHSVQNRTHLQYIRTPTLAWMTMGCCVNFSAKSIQCCTHTYNAKTRHCLVVIIYRPKKKKRNIRMRPALCLCKAMLKEDITYCLAAISVRLANHPSPTCIN